MSGPTGDGCGRAAAAGRRAGSHHAGDGPPPDTDGGAPSCSAPDGGGRARRTRAPCLVGRAGPGCLGHAGRAPRCWWRPRSPARHGCHGQRIGPRGRGARRARARAGGADRALRAERPAFPGAHAAGRHPRPPRGPACRAGSDCSPALFGASSVDGRARRPPSGARGPRAGGPDSRGAQAHNFSRGRLFSLSLNSSASGSGSFFSEMFGHVLE